MVCSIPRYAKTKQIGVVQAGIQQYQRQLAAAQRKTMGGCYMKIPKAKPVVQNQPLQLSNFQFVFWELMAGLGLGLILLCFECMWRYKNPENN